MHDTISQVIAKLNSNAILKATVTAITPFKTSKINTMYYKAVKLQSDRVVGQIRFELTAITDTYKKAIKAITEAEKSLLTFGDTPLTDTILSITRNGGASMENVDTNTFHETVYFTIIYKERI